MKLLKSWKTFESAKSVEDICNKYGIRNWTLNEDGTVDVDGNVSLNNKKLDELPLKFGRVTGYFDCSDNNLTSLEGCPDWIGDDFVFSSNKLTSLECIPNFIGRRFDCSFNLLTSLEGCPERIYGNFNCSHNKLTSLLGGPNLVDGNFDCYMNKLTNLEGCPEKIYGELYCRVNNIISLDFYPTILTGRLFTSGNPIEEIWLYVWQHKPNNHGHYLHLFDLHTPIRYEGDEWICYRESLDNFFQEIGVPAPPKLKNYREV